jgi:thiamine-phosphate pyrophosphorylase
VRGKTLPRLFFFTDALRTPDPEAIAARLPRGAGIVFRAFGAPDAVARGRRLAAIARRRGLVLLAGADPALAAGIGADGVHLPERDGTRARALRTARPGWLVTAAAHSRAAILRARRAGAHAVFVSPVFPSASPTAGRALGPVRFAALVRGAPPPVYALGGIDARAARRIAASGAAGFAAVDAFRT